MLQTPFSQSCPAYAPASQITPDSVDELPTQENILFTQESRRVLFDTINQSSNHNNNRNYYDQLFSSDSEDDDTAEPSDMSISDSDCSSVSLPAISSFEHLPFSAFSDNHQPISPKSDMSISFSSNSDMSISDSSSTTSSDESSISSSDSNSFTSNDSDNSSVNYFNPDYNKSKEICGITDLLEKEEIDNLLGIHEISRPPPEQESLPKSEIDKIGSFNIRNKYDHDIAAFFMMKEDLSFLAIQEPFPATNLDSKSWTNYRKNELESARITSYETPFQVILFDSWKWGGKIISPFQSTHHGRATSIAFQFNDTQQLGIISIYASTQECAQEEKGDEFNNISSLTISIEKIIKRLHHQFPGICIMVLGDFQETISITDKDNLGNYRKAYKSNGILANLLSTHTSIVRDLNPEPNYITRFGEAGGRGIDHILFPTNPKHASWIVSAKVERNSGAMFFPSDHSYINCNFHRQGSNNNQDSIEVRRFDFKKICNIKLKRTNPSLESPEFILDDSQFKDCSNFADQQKMYNEIQSITANKSSLSNYYLNETEARIGKLYNDIWKEGIKQR